VNLVDELHAITTALHAAGVRYAVVGGLAGRDQDLADLARLEESDG